MRFKLAAWGLAVLAIGALTACGGGGGGGDAGGGTTAAAAGGGAPTGTSVAVAAAAAPAATNTASNPNQAFALILTAGGAPVVIQSPPVLNFAVIDSTGKHVPGLTLFNAAGATADPNCSGNNVTAAIAKLDVPADNSPATWQSLISRQRMAADTGVRYAVTEGSIDPKPTATITNPATALTDPSTRIVGILEENATGGYYTYRFATDVSTTLLMADAVAGKNVATTSTQTANKIANNGNLAVKDGKTIHRVGLQLCYTDPATKAKVVVNPIFDFTVGADGIGVAVKAADGKTPTDYRKVVDKASCNECHGTLTVHGTRVDPNYCVICHNANSKDYTTNTTIDFKLMVHKVHMGKELTKDYVVNRISTATSGGVVAKLTNTTTGLVSGIVYPQAQQNCVKCHDGSASATNKTTQGDNWKSVPSRNACGACHDGIDFLTGKGTTLGGATTGHIGGAKGDDKQCVLCHDATSVPVYHQDTMTTTEDAAKRTMSATISKVEVGATDGSVTVTFTVSDGGVAVTDSTKFTKPQFSLAKLVPGALVGESSHWVSYTGRFRTKDATKEPVLQGYSENGGTLTANADGTFSYKFALATADVAGDIRTVTHAHNVSTVAPYATTTWTGAGATVAGTGVNIVAYEPALTHRVGMEFQKVGTPNVDAVTNAYFDFVPDGSAVSTTRNIVTMNNCSACHAGVKLHKGYATEYCVTCHNQSTFDPYTGETVDLQRFIHKLHRGKDLPSIQAGGIFKINAIDFAAGRFPGNIADCAFACHKETGTKPGTTALLENAANWYKVPSKRACEACHDSTAALAHINGQVTAAQECTTCHGATTTFGLDVKSVHNR